MSLTKPKVVKEQANSTSSPSPRRLGMPGRNLRREDWEPITILPPEIATVCLLQALPLSTSGDYPARLLELSSVSRRWERFLVTSPIFWTTIHIKYQAHDLLATIALFAHLSGQAKIKLIFWNELGREWDAIKSLLLPHARRISRITLGNDPPIYSDTPFRDVGYILLVTNIVKSFGCLPSLAEIDFGCALELTPSQLKLLDLPSNARVMSLVRVSLQNSAIGSLFLTPLVSNGAPDDTWMDYRYEEQLFYELLLKKHPLGAVEHQGTTIFAINSGISSLASVLKSLDSPFTSIKTLADSACANFISGNRCLLCRDEKSSLSRVLGCVRSHFDVRPFQCTGCRSCNAANGFARFYTSQQLNNHKESTTCTICGTQTTRGLELEHDEDTLCDRCNPRNTEEALRLHERCKKMWRNAYATFVVSKYVVPTDMKLWKALYTEAMQYTKPIILGMGIFFQWCSEKTETGIVIQKSVIFLEQTLSIGLNFFLPIQSLEEMIGFFCPRFQEYQEQTRGIVVLPQALSPFFKPSVVDLMTLGGLSSRKQDEQVWQGKARNGTAPRHCFECEKSFNRSSLASENT